jgi:hypothetical protein
MSDEKQDPRPQFFKDVHALAQDHGVLAYVIVGVVHRDGALAIASGAGSRLDDAADITPRVYGLIEKSFEKAMVSIAAPDGPAIPKGSLVN